MKRGTTPTHEFYLEFGTDMLKAVEITYKQNDVIVLQKHIEDCTLEDNKITCKLTQEDTFKFDEESCVEVQLRVLTIGEDVLASDVVRVCCDECLSEEVLA